MERRWGRRPHRRRRRHGRPHVPARQLCRLHDHLRQRHPRVHAGGPGPRARRHRRRQGREALQLRRWREKKFRELLPHAGDGLTVTGTANDDFVAGSYGLDSLSGLQGNDFLDGQDGDDSLDGGDGDDTLIGGGGDDRIDGGAGMGDRTTLLPYTTLFRSTYDSVTHEYTLVDQAPGRDGTD